MAFPFIAAPVLARIAAPVLARIAAPIVSRIAAPVAKVVAPITSTIARTVAPLVKGALSFATKPAVQLGLVGASAAISVFNPQKGTPVSQPTYTPTPKSTPPPQFLQPSFTPAPSFTPNTALETLGIPTQTFISQKMQTNGMAQPASQFLSQLGTLGGQFLGQALKGGGLGGRGTGRRVKVGEGRKYSVYQDSVTGKFYATSKFKRSRRYGRRRRLTNFEKQNMAQQQQFQNLMLISALRR